MDAKEVKQLLKNAKEAIKNKEFKDAIKHCKSVLKLDKNNYNAFVFVGVAAEGLEQPDQALNAYTRATELSPDQILAWQGLAAFYEKSNEVENLEQHAAVYEKLIKLNEASNDKKIVLIKKILNLYKQADKFPEMCVLYKQILPLVDDKISVHKEIISVFELYNPSSEIIQMLADSYEVVINDSANCDNEKEQIWVKYIKYLEKKKTWKDVEFECRRCLSHYPNCLYATEVLVFIDITKFSIDNVWKQDLYDIEIKFENLNMNSFVMTLVKGWNLFHMKKYVEALTQLVEFNNKNPQVIIGWYILGLSYLCLHQHRNAERCLSTGLKLCGKTDCCHYGDLEIIAENFRICHARCNIDEGSSQNVKRAYSILQKLNHSNEKLILLGFCHLLLGEVEKSIECHALIPSSDTIPDCLMLKGCYFFHKEQFNDALVCFEDAYEHDASNGLYCYWIARVKMEFTKQNSVSKDVAFAAFLKAAKQDPYFCETYYFLGEIYEKFDRNKEKAKKCFLKSFNLKPNYDEAGKALVDVMIELGEEEKILSILESVTTNASAGCAKWAWLRLGLRQLKFGDTDSALTSLQCALRADPEDCHVWECLGEAYMHRGSYTAARKAFQRAVDLQADSLYSLYKIATIKQTLGVYNEAIDNYLLLLSKSDNYVPALKGLAETYVQLARCALGKFFHGRAIDLCQKAILTLVRAVSIRSDLSCLWKCLGDACTIIHVVPAEICQVSVSQKLLDSFRKVDDTCIIDKVKLLAVGGRCYGQALRILPDSSYLWHDLGVNYYCQSMFNSENRQTEFIEKSLSSLKKAVSLANNSYKHWLALGVVAIIYDPSLAQHCFIKSIESEPNNVVAWTNLGSLYLKHSNIELAHEAFKKAQSLEPSYVSSWIGQSIIAENVGHEDAMDLFRHTTGLSSHVESAIGYGNWVCSFLRSREKYSSEVYDYSINQMTAVPVASDLLVKYTDRRRKCAVGFNLSGMLLERQNRFKSACEAYKTAVELSADTDYNDLARINLARTLCKVKEFPETLNQWNKVERLDNFEDVCGYALACYLSGEYDKCISAYEKAISLAPSKKDESDVYAAMGKLNFVMEDYDTSKTALFQCVQSDTPSFFGLESLCCLGMLQADSTLTLAVLQELVKIDSSDARHSLAWLILRFYVLAGEPEKAVTEVNKLASYKVENAKIFHLLSVFISEYIPSWSKSAIDNSQKAFELDRKYNPAFVMAKCLLVGDKNPIEALRAAEKLVHIRPDLKINWDIFYAALNKTIASFHQSSANH